MRVAVLSDVHGNVPALDAVLEDMARQSFDAVVCLGDHVSGPVDPAGAASRLMALGALAIRGNHDRAVLECAPDNVQSVDGFARAQLDEAQLVWLAQLPATAQLSADVFLCHGTPRDDLTAWLDNFYDRRMTRLPSEDEVAREAAGLDFPVMLCGHTHVARTVRLRDGRLILNPGAVGMQLVRGTPDAHYAILEQRQTGWHTALVGVPYDNEAAVRMAEANGFAQWGDSIRYGWASPESLA